MRGIVIVRLCAVLIVLLLGSVVPATGQEPSPFVQEVMAWGARHDTVQFYTACAPVGLHVFVIDDDEDPIGLTVDRVRTMAESRLRAARLYTSERLSLRARLVLFVRVFRNAYAEVVEIEKRFTDEFTGRTVLRPSVSFPLVMGTPGSNPDFIIMQRLTESVDEIINRYLRVNEADCR